MRLRFAVLASLLTAVCAVAVPSAASARPRHNQGLTIKAVPNPILAGENVLIYGRLEGTEVANKTIVLFHRVPGTHLGFTRVAATQTDPRGFYEFTRAENVVMTNRAWFVRKADEPAVHSRTVFERVEALITLTATPTAQDTMHPVLFTGEVTPNHAFQRVLLQAQAGSSDEWRTIDVAHLDGNSRFAITHRFLIPGERDLRVVLPRDARNMWSTSDPVTVTTEQAQVPDLTINTSQPIVDQGGSATISGVLDRKGTTSPEGNTIVQLWAHTPGELGSRLINVTTTDGTDGSYSFTVPNLTTNTLYQVRTAFPPRRHSAVLFEGVHDEVMLMPSSTTSTVGGTVTFTGTVVPDKAGHVIYLQRLGTDGDWHTVDIRLVRFGSTFQFAWTFGTTGPHTFRARITSDGLNVGSESSPVTIQVAPAPVQSLPPAS
jgi:hypothetical protein